MSSEAHYSVEIAKSGKSSCKRCKTKIEKGALRIITTQHNGNYEQKGYHHPACFNLPKKYAQGAGKITAADFVRTILEDASESGRDILPEKLEELATAIATTTPKKKKDTGADDADESTPKGWIAKVKAAYNAAQEEEEEEGKEPAAKKVKTDGGGPGSVVTPAHIEAYSKIHKLKNDELTDILRWNKQILKGSKDLLLTKVMDGMMYGRLTRCQLCGGDHPGKLKITEANVQQVICGGGFDDDLKRPIPCNFTSTPDKAPRWQPWYMEAPTEEEDAAMDKLIEDMKGGGDGTGAKAGGSDDPNVPVLVAAVQAEIGDDEDGWKLKGKGVKKATVTLTKVLLAHATTTDDSKKAGGGEVVEGLKTIDLPRDDEDNDYKKAKMKVAEVVTMNKDKAIDEMIPLLIESFGYVEDKAAKAAKKESNLASMVTVPANAPVIAALNELAEFYFKEGNRNAGGTYKKAISVLSELDYEITKENAKGLGAGKNKVAGIGKGTAEKLYEFCTTGTIGKLEEKRRESA